VQEGLRPPEKEEGGKGISSISLISSKTGAGSEGECGLLEKKEFQHEHATGE